MTPVEIRQLASKLAPNKTYSFKNLVIALSVHEHRVSEFLREQDLLKFNICNTGSRKKAWQLMENPYYAENLINLFNKVMSGDIHGVRK